MWNTLLQISGLYRRAHLGIRVLCCAVQWKHLQWALKTQLGWPLELWSEGKNNHHPPSHQVWWWQHKAWLSSLASHLYWVSTVNFLYHWIRASLSSKSLSSCSGLMKERTYLSYFQTIRHSLNCKSATFSFVSGAFTWMNHSHFYHQGLVGVWWEPVVLFCVPWGGESMAVGVVGVECHWLWHGSTFFLSHSCKWLLSQLCDLCILCLQLPPASLHLHSFFFCSTAITLKPVKAQ